MESPTGRPANFLYSPLFPLADDMTPWRKLPIEGVRMSKEAMYYDTSKARTELGYVPGPVDGAIRSAIAWFTEHGYLSKRR